MESGAAREGLQGLLPTTAALPRSAWLGLLQGKDSSISVPHSNPVQSCLAGAAAGTQILEPFPCIIPGWVTPQLLAAAVKKLGGGGEPGPSLPDPSQQAVEEPLWQGGIHFPTVVSWWWGRAGESGCPVSSSPPPPPRQRASVWLDCKRYQEKKDSKG